MSTLDILAGFSLLAIGLLAVSLMIVGVCKDLIRLFHYFFD
jgi:hypothetical protein